MSEFKRLLDDEATDDFEADLLRFARREGPSAEGRAKILAGLGVGAITTATDSASGTPAQTAAGSGAKSAGLLKWVAIGAGVVAIPLAAWLLSQPKSEAPALIPNTTVAPPAAVEAPPPAPANDTKQGVEPDVTQLEDLPVLPSASSHGSSASSAEPSLADEVKAIQRAKTALSSGNANLALKELDAYKAEFPRGRLGQEASVLRIEALSASGNSGTAQKLGQAFLKANPKSPYAARVRSVIGAE